MAEEKHCDCAPLLDNEVSDKADNSRTFWRLMGYVKPYWFRMVLGVAAGLLVGSSLFFSIILIPKMAGTIEPNNPTDAAKSSENTRKIIAISDDPRLTDAEKSSAIEAVLNPLDNDPKLTEMARSFKKSVESYNLPITVDGFHVTVHWPKKFSFNLVDPDGKVGFVVLLAYMIGFSLLWGFKNIMVYANAYYTNWVGMRVVTDMRDEIFRKITNQSLKFFGKVDVGELISRSTNDTGAIQNVISGCVSDLTRCPLEVVACVAAIVVMGAQYNNYALPIIMFIGLPLAMVPISLLRRLIRRVYGMTFAQIAAVLSKMHEIFSCIKVVKAYDTEKSEQAAFHELNYKYFRSMVRVMKPQLMMSPLMEFIMVVAVCGFLGYSYCENVTLSQIFSLLAPAFVIYRPIKDLARLTGQIQMSLAAADRYFNLIDLNMELPESPNPRPLTEFTGKIAVGDVSFSYDGRTILDRINLNIERGKVVAVVGETGSGKTTLANLIARFYDVDSGSIRIDGTDVREFRIADLRKMVGIVNQESILFNDTIANNIAYGCPGASREEIVAAAKQANAHCFIVDGRHTEGYDTVVGEKGFKLSGGEKQRIAIARAILQNPPILILDEATSALDTVTEKLVQEALNNVMNNRTVFAIAHRLSTIKDADLIIVLAHGKIIEQGTHQELLDLGGVYRKLHDTQFAK